MSGDDPVTRGFIQRFVSFEVLSAIATCIFFGSLSWGTITRDVAAANDKVQETSAKAEKISDDVSKIKTDVEIVKANLLNADSRAREQAGELREQRRDIKQILELLHESGGARGR